MKTKFKTALLEADKAVAEDILINHLKNSGNKELVSKIITETLYEIGEEWEKGDVALSQIYMSGRICEDIVKKVFNEIQQPTINHPKMAIVTLQDYHLLGKKVVYSVLKSSGFVIIDFGSVNSTDILVEKTIENNVEILLISTLMYHSALKIKDVVQLFRDKNHQIKILVGGAPFIFDTRLWEQVNADAMGVSPSDAISVLNQWIGRN